MAYLISNICTENYWNLTTTVKIIVGGWAVYFFGTQCCNITYCRWTDGNASKTVYLPVSLCSLSGYNEVYCWYSG